MAKDVVLVINRFEHDILSELEREGGCNVVCYEKDDLTSEGIASFISTMPQKPTAIIVRSAPITKDVIDAAEGALKIIVRGGASYSTIDHTYAASLGIPVTNTLNTNAEAVAEWTAHAIREGISGIREGIKQGEEAYHADTVQSFAKKHTFGFTELTGKKIAIIGAGFIGEKVARKLAADNCKVYIHSRSFKPKHAEYLMCKYGGTFVSAPDIETAMKNADAVTIHVPLMRETIGMITEAHIQSMHNGAVLVNTCPVGILNMEGVARQLGVGKFRGVYFDAFQKDKGILDTISAYPNVVITPLIASETVEADIVTTQAAVSRVRAYIEDGRADSCVNPSFIEHNSSRTHTVPPSAEYKIGYKEEKELVKTFEALLARRDGAYERQIEVLEDKNAKLRAKNEAQDRLLDQVGENSQNPSWQKRITALRRTQSSSELFRIVM